MAVVEFEGNVGRAMDFDIAVVMMDDVESCGVPEEEL